MSDARQFDRRDRRRFQFSIRLLLAVTAVVAVVVAVSLSFYRQREAGRRAGLFYRAVRGGDLAEVDRLLKVDPRLAHGRDHGSGYFSHTALQTSLGILRNYNPKVVDRILKENPDVNERSSGGETALHIAASLGLLTEVQRLLRLGADVNAVDDRGNTPLSLAVDKHDRTGIVTKSLLDGGADPDLAPANALEGKTPLHVAAEGGNRILVKLLLDAGAQVNARDIKGRTPLHLAAVADHVGLDVCELLAEHDANLTAKADRLIPGERADGSNSGVAALLWWERILHLLDQEEGNKLDQLLDAAPQAVSFRFAYEPTTMLERAMAAKRLDILDCLLARRPNRIFDDFEKLPPLHDACWFNTPVEKAKNLLDGGAEVNVRDPFGQTPLHAAAREHNHDVLRLLLARGADVRAVDKAGANVLDTAFERSFILPEARQTLDLLREAGHPPTVLYAAAVGNLDLLKELTSGNRGLLDRVYTRTGVRPLHAAVMGNQPKIIEWLFEQGVEREPTARPDWNAVFKETPLMRALSYDLPDIAILLIQHSADVNRKSGTGHYPVHAVIDWGRDPRILEALLAHSADPTLRYEDKTARELAKASKSQYRERYIELLNGVMHKSTVGSSRLTAPGSELHSQAQ